jgi:hypothetical protein
MQLVGIYAWRGKAYLPVQAQIQSGPYMDVEPIYISDFDASELAKAIEKVIAAGHPRLPDPTREEARTKKSPTLLATKARSWKELARTGASYTIVWDDNEIRIDMSRLDAKGRWEYDPQKKQTLPPDTPLATIVDIILEDIRSRPEVMMHGA